MLQLKDSPWFIDATNKAPRFNIALDILQSNLQLWEPNL